MKTKIEFEKVPWPKGKLVELNNGSIALTAQGNGNAIVLVSTSVQKPVGYFYHKDAYPLKIDAIKRIITEPCGITFNLTSYE